MTDYRMPLVPMLVGPGQVLSCCVVPPWPVKLGSELDGRFLVIPLDIACSFSVRRIRIGNDDVFLGPDGRLPDPVDARCFSPLALPVTLSALVPLGLQVVIEVVNISSEPREFRGDVLAQVVDDAGPVDHEVVDLVDDLMLGNVRPENLVARLRTVGELRRKAKNQ